MAQHTFITGQFVRIDQQLANAGQRVVAAILDLIFKFILASALVSLVLGAGGAFNQYYGNESMAVFLSYFFVVMPVLCYDMIFEYFCNGRSLGKMIMGLRVVAADGSKPSSTSIFFRFIFYLLEGYTGFGIVVMLFTKDNQRLGDIAGETYVIKTRTVYMGNMLAAAKSQFPQGYMPVYPQAAQLSMRQVEVIQECFYAKGEDAYSMKVELAQKICQFLKINVSNVPVHQFFSQLIYDYRFVNAE